MSRANPSNKPNPSYTTVVRPILRHRNACVLLDSYPNFNPDAVPEGTGWGWSYLHCACVEGDMWVVRGLVQCGASLLRKGPRRCTALHWSCMRGHVNLVTCLLSEYADVRFTINCKATNGRTPLHIAAYMGLQRCVGTLLRYGADPTIVDEDEMTAGALVRAVYGTRARTLAILKAGERTWAVLALGEWRPRLQATFPRGYRFATRTLTLLAKAQPEGQQGIVAFADGTCGTVPRHPCACLNLLPEELLQYLFIFVCAAPVPDVWTAWCAR